MFRFCILKGDKLFCMCQAAGGDTLIKTADAGNLFVYLILTGALKT